MRGKEGVLGSASTGLIFTRIHEGAQPGGLTQPQPGQTEPSIPYHVPSCWVPVGGRCGGNSLAARESSVAVWSGREGLWVVQFVSCFLLICIIVVPVPFVCSSVKLPLSRPTSFLPVSFRWGKRRLRGAFVTGCSQNQNRGKRRGKERRGKNVFSS